jgi:hypothetical protein
MKSKKMTTKELEEKFEAGEDISESVEWGNATKTITLDLPIWALQSLSEESKRRGIARQALIKMWVIDKLDSLSLKKLA